MSDLSNITKFTGITIESDQTTGTNNLNATFAVPCVTTAQRDLLENVTPYIVATGNVKVKPGTIVFNITANALQVFINGTWQTITTTP